MLKLLVRTALSIHLVAMCLLVTPAFGAPRGAVRLAPKNLVKNSGFYCGYHKKKWIPGKVISGKLFYSHAAERANLQSELKRAKGKKRKSIESKVDTLTKQINQRSALCAGGNTSSTRVRFDLTGAKALVLSDSTQAASTYKYARRAIGSLSNDRSNLKKVLGNGTLAPAFSGSKGSVSVSRFLVGPNDTLYVLFTSPICLDDPSSYNCSPKCLLAQVSADSGEVACIESELTSINWNYTSNSGISSSKPIQFDSEGNIYYLGTGSSTQLRRYSVATKTTSDIINQNINITGFLVLGDGSILLAGATQSSNTYWLRKKMPGANGEMVNVATIGPSWLSSFPDGRIYMGGFWGGSGNEYNTVQRLSQSSTSLEPINWIETSTYNPKSAYHYFSGGVTVVAMHRTPDRHVYALTGYSPNYSLVELYPHPHKISSSISRITGVKPVVSDLIIFGTDNSGNGKMVLYNTINNQEVDLLAGRNIEVYRAEFSASDNTVQFDGLRFSDGKYVLCSVDLASPNPACSPTGSTKLVDFQSISTPGVGLPPADVTPTPLPLVSYDMSGARAVFSALSNSGPPPFYEPPQKISVSGAVAQLSSFKESGLFFKTQVNGDGQANIWLVGETYITDADTVPCNLASVNRSSGLVTCVYSGGGDIGVIRTSPEGRTYFTATTSSGSDATTSLWSYFGGATTQLAQTIGGKPEDGVITSDGGILLARWAYWVKKFTSSGSVLNHGNLDGYRLGQLSDGSILLWGGSSIKLLNDTGSTVTSNDWRNDAGCVASDSNVCYGNFEKLFTLASGSSYGFHTAYGMRRVFPAPITALTMTTVFKNYHSIPNLSSVAPSATSSEGAVFIGGRSAGEDNKVVSYNPATQVESDLTDDPSFLPVSILHSTGALYLYGLRSGMIVAGVKDLGAGGGTTLSTVGTATYYNTIAPEMVPVVP